MKCKTCQWWKDSELRALSTKAMEVRLGYCEPERHVGGSASITVVRKHHCGLTDEDYSCGEHQERGHAE